MELQHYIALTELPQGQQPGQRFTATAEVGGIYLGIGAVRKETATERRAREAEEKPVATTAAEAKPESSTSTPATPAGARGGRNYGRRDMTAVDSGN